MSWLFPNDGRLGGTLTGSYGSNGITFGAFLKMTAHPLASDCYLAFGNSTGTVDDSIALRTGGSAGQWQVLSTVTGGANASALISGFTPDAATIGTTYNATAGWFAFVGQVAADDNLRVGWIGNTSNTATSGVLRVIGNALKHVYIGENLAASQDANALVAEVAIWDGILSTPQVASYMAGNVASGIQAANLIAYYALKDSGVLTNAGTDSGGTLTPLALGGQAWDSDHPTITYPTTSAPSLFVVRSALRLN